MTDLKPCPFCGNAPRVEWNDDYGTIECETVNCPASPISSGDLIIDPLKAFLAWNTRADLATERERKLVEALKFYADPDLDGYEIHVTNYGLSTEDGHIIKDAGDKARATLKELGYE